MIVTTTCNVAVDRFPSFLRMYCAIKRTGLAGDIKTALSELTKNVDA